MKKTLLLALAVLSPQVFAADVDLECKEIGMGLEYKFIRLKDPVDDIGSAYFFSVFFDENGNFSSYTDRSYHRRAHWRDTEILIEVDFSLLGSIDRQTLKFKGLYPYPTTEYDCEIADNHDEKRQRWKKEADDAKKARSEAKKAKNVI